VIRDQDRVYGTAVTRRLRAMGIRDKPIAPGSPWQNGFAERLIGSIRRECADHVIALGEAHLRLTLQAYARYYNVASYYPSLYVIDPKRSGCRFRGPAVDDWRVWTRSTRHFAASDCNVDRVKSQGPSERGCSASIWRRSAARRRVFGLTLSTAAACVRFIHPSASDVSG
jgi:Integrase core domain